MSTHNAPLEPVDAGRPRLTFVYNADSGLFNTLTDIAHKALSPATYGCRLCALTHGAFSVREAWVQFLKSFDADCEFLHRDEFVARYGKAYGPAPAVYRATATGPEVLIDAAALKSLASLADLMDLLRRITPTRSAPADGNVGCVEGEA